ncbi:hypothetical protein FBD77_07880 [Clostridium butyricum]|nr:hypothetical protein [Clostridium butyricum]
MIKRAKKLMTILLTLTVVLSASAGYLQQTMMDGQRPVRHQQQTMENGKNGVMNGNK